jgi:hypothetical protein
MKARDEKMGMEERPEYRKYKKYQINRKGVFS